MLERWTPIKGYPLYEVSDHGRVRNVKRNKLLGMSINRSHYDVILYNEYGKKHFKVHRLVAAHFIAPIPEGYVINHMDGDKLNNHYSNLEIVTVAENNNHAIRRGLLNPNRKVFCHNNLTVYPSIKVAARELGLHRSNITLVCSGKRKHTQGYQFSYWDRG